jgi:hypothetical protein
MATDEAEQARDVDATDGDEAGPTDVASTEDATNGDSEAATESEEPAPEPTDGETTSDETGSEVDAAQPCWRPCDEYVGQRSAWRALHLERKLSSVLRRPPTIPRCDLTPTAPFPRCPQPTARTPRGKLPG